MKQKLAIRTIVLLGDPEWVDYTLNRSWLQEGVLQTQRSSKSLAGGQSIELRRRVEYVDTRTAEDALRQIKEAGSPLLRDPLEPPNTTDLPEEGKES